MNPRVVPSGRGVHVVYTGPLRHRCPFVDELDRGTVTITWATAGGTLELHSLAAWLDGFAEPKITHEDVTADIRDELAALDGITDVEVSSTWHTAGAEVIVRAVPRERVKPGVA